MPGHASTSAHRVGENGAVLDMLVPTTNGLTVAMYGVLALVLLPYIWHQSYNIIRKVGPDGVSVHAAILCECPALLRLRCVD